MNNAAERIRELTRSFHLSREQMIRIAEMAERRGVYPIGSKFRHALTQDLTEEIALLDPLCRWELMCLMYLGRNIDYYDLDEAMPDFEDHIRNPWRGCSEPDYLAGKTPLGKWLRLVMDIMKG